jgi:2,4-dienoyl-CoA reductase-like NADH-dependent reductase (Old Yellow Enzyme family)
LRRYAQAGRTAGNQFWMQINHPGRQVERRINRAPLAPSSVSLEVAYGQIRRFTRKANALRAGNGSSIVNAHSVFAHYMRI